MTDPFNVARIAYEHGEATPQDEHKIDDWPGGFYCLTCTPLAEYGVPVSLWPTKEAVTHGGEVAPQAGKVATDRQDAVSEHLPECLIPTDLNRGFWLYNTFTGLCICKELHACEQRVLEAAVQRIEALPWTSETWNAHAERAAVIAAIKGDQR